ncbi:O-antigen ligase family protein [Pelagibacteraceae bacterium]|nr:O-antigen ligase family protein [Pelagibacteraceae bacterium]
MTYIYLFIPFALVTGSFLSDLSISILGLYFIFISFKEKLWDYYKNYFTYIFVFFYFVLIASSLKSQYFVESISVSLFYFRYLFFVLATVYLVNNNKIFLRYFFISLLVAIFVVTFDGYLQYITGTNSLGWQFDERLSGLFADNKVIGTYLARLLPIMFGLYLLNKNINQKIYILLLALIVLVEILIFLSGERSAFFLVSLSTLTILILLKNNKQLRLIAFLIVSLSVVLITNFIPDTKYRMFDQTISEFQGKDYSYNTRSYEEKNIYIFSKNHDDYLRTSLNMFQSQPILGHGPRTFRIMCNDELYSKNQNCSTHPHNIYLELLGEVGMAGTLPLLIGLIIILYFFLKQFFILLYNRSKEFITDFDVCMLAAIFINIFPFIPTLSFYNNWSSIMLYLPIGLILSKKLKVTST